MYFFSTDSFAAATGLVSTHFAPLSSARVAAADALGFFFRNGPFTSTQPAPAAEYVMLIGVVLTA